MRFRNIVLGAVFVLLSTHSVADFYTGNKLKSFIDEDGYSKGIGTGFIVGVADTIGRLDLVCLPDGPSGVTVGQLREVVMKFLRENPEKLNQSAANLVYLSLVDVWPCKRKSESAPVPAPSTAPAPIPNMSSPKPKPKPKEETSPF